MPPKKKLIIASKSKPPYVGGNGLSGAKIAIVGMAPGKDEEEKGMPFVGRA